MNLSARVGIKQRPKRLSILGWLLMITVTLSPFKGAYAYSIELMLNKETNICSGFLLNNESVKINVTSNVTTDYIRIDLIDQSNKTHIYCIMKPEEEFKGIKDKCIPKSVNGSVFRFDVYIPLTKLEGMKGLIAYDDRTCSDELKLPKLFKLTDRLIINGQEIANFSDLSVLLIYDSPLNVTYTVDEKLISTLLELNYKDDVFKGCPVFYNTDLPKGQQKSITLKAWICGQLYQLKTLTIKSAQNSDEEGSNVVAIVVPCVFVVILVSILIASWVKRKSIERFIDRCSHREESNNPPSEPLMV